MLDGLLVDLGSHVGTVNAECNWWNSSTGPTNPNNPGGTGEEVVGDADFTPWLIARAPGGACLGGAPPTPGKVTGGGQIEGDPIFTPLGDLMSVPALISSLSDPRAQATFGRGEVLRPDREPGVQRPSGGRTDKGPIHQRAVHQQPWHVLPGDTWKQARQVHRHGCGDSVDRHDHGVLHR